jgi:DNA-binding CsgD family transcriptional regulator
MSSDLESLAEGARRVIKLAGFECDGVHIEDEASTGAESGRLLVRALVEVPENCFDTGATQLHLEQQLRILAAASWVSISARVFLRYSQRKRSYQTVKTSVGGAPKALETPSVDVRLTPRELQVLELMYEGHANQSIAQVIGRSPSTARFHVASIMRKLGARSKTQAVVEAMKLALIKPLPRRRT